MERIDDNVEGFGLYVFVDGGVTQVYVGTSVPSVVFPSRDTTWIDE